MEFLLTPSSLPPLFVHVVIECPLNMSVNGLYVGYTVWYLCIFFFFTFRIQLFLDHSKTLTQDCDTPSTFPRLLLLEILILWLFQCMYLCAIKNLVSFTSWCIYSELASAKDLWLQMDGIATKCCFSKRAYCRLLTLGISKVMKISSPNLNDMDFRS